MGAVQEEFRFALIQSGVQFLEKPQLLFGNQVSTLSFNHGNGPPFER